MPGSRYDISALERRVKRVARRYGVYRASEGVTERALFVINSEGVIHWSHVSPVGVNPGAAGIIHALEELQAKGQPK